MNPQKFTALSTDSAFNSAISFVTNTDWQGYSGESTMSYATQMLAFTVQNFLSAATGMAVAFALMRGFSRRSADGIGNFWVDVTRSTLYVLLPLSMLLAILLMAQGVAQNFDAYRDVGTLETLTYANPKLDASGTPLVDAHGNPVTEPAHHPDANPAHGTGRLPGGDQDDRAPTAAACSMRTRPIPTRIRRRSRTSRR